MNGYADSNSIYPSRQSQYTPGPPAPVPYHIGGPPPSFPKPYPDRGPLPTEVRGEDAEMGEVLMVSNVSC